MQRAQFHKGFSIIISILSGLTSIKKILLINLLMFLLICCSQSTKQTPVQPKTETGEINGTVIDSLGYVSGAVVRVQTTDLFSLTGDSGKFIFTGLTSDKPVSLTAWAKGYYIGGGEEFLPDTNNVEIKLIAHANEDNPDYSWLSAFSEAGEAANCQNCHSLPNDPSSALPFDEWRRDAHANSALNRRFLTMYQGTDVYGNQSPLTRYGYNRDYGSFPLRPHPDQPYFGPGYKLDFPNTSGNCAACHTPLPAIDYPYGVNPSEVSGVEKEGINCDFCHKVWDVKLNETSGLPFDNMPGVLSFEFRRPPDGHQFFAGPLDDVAPGEDTYSPIQRQSQYCAPCHSGKFWGIQIYNSFGEWLDSPYSDPQTGKTCQDCHMPSALTDHFVRFDKGGNKRNPATIFSHRMPGAKDIELLQDAVSMTVSANFQADSVRVNVEIINDKTGHHIPTDSPLRHLILLVQATDESGTSLFQTNGPTLPDWCGIGETNQGYYAGLPGTSYAKILEELWTGIAPTAAYWNMTRLISDNRIPAYGSDKTSYTFVKPTSGSVLVNVQLIFRRAFIALTDWKSWDTPDIIIAHESLTLGE